jgi:hypothetical protein
MNPRARGRGIEVVVVSGLVLIALDALAMLIVSQVLARRFGVEFEWWDPHLSIPIATMLLTAGLAVEALVQRRSEGVMVVHAAVSLVVGFGVPAWFGYQASQL